MATDPHPATRIAKLGHVAAVTPDLDASVRFFRDVVGLREVERVDGTVYLRGLRDREHHTLGLSAGNEAAVDHVAWRTRSPADVGALADRFEADGLEVDRRPAGGEPGVGEAVRVRSPTGHRYEFYFDVDRPPAPEGVRSRLRNRVYSEAVANRIAPRRIDHVHVQDPDGAGHADWLQGALGFRPIERFRAAGELWGWWLSVTPLPHDVAVHRIEAGQARFHHLAYHVDDLRDLWAAADALREHGIAPDGGPGRHAITNADFLYVRDPASGLRLELFAGPGYLVLDPDWEPIDWTDDEIGGEDDHQWIGTQFSPDGTPYR